MRHRYVLDRVNRGVLVADAAAVAASMLLAWMVRAQFRFFLFDLLSAAVILPWIVLARILVALFFEHYAVTVGSLTTRDIARLFVHGLGPTAILLVLRFVAPVRWLRVPLSMIGMEYVFSHFGFAVIRFVAAWLWGTRGGVSARHRRRVVLWGEIADLRKVGPPGVVEAANGVLLRAILSPNPLFWDTDWGGVRVHGGADALRELIAADDSISLVCIVEPRYLTYRQFEALSRQCGELGLEMAALDQGRIEPKSVAQLEEMAMASGAGG